MLKLLLSNPQYFNSLAIAGENSRIYLDKSQRTRIFFPAIENQIGSILFCDCSLVSFRLRVQNYTPRAELSRAIPFWRPLPEGFILNSNLFHKRLKYVPRGSPNT
jgi:hypothetical protein